jgi:hypothetical protein
MVMWGTRVRNTHAKKPYLCGSRHNIAGANQIRCNHFKPAENARPSFFLFLEFLAGKVRLGGDGMVWGFIALVVIAVVLAGRAHSRYLDRQDQLWADIIDGQAEIIASEQRVVATRPA